MTSVCLVADCLKSYDKYREINIMMRLGPTLVGDKPMHVFCFNKGFKFINELLNDIELLFSNHSSIRYKYVYSHNESIKVIFYNKHSMTRLLDDQRIQRFLSSHGYDVNSTAEMYMDHLANNLKDNLIPSEFGVFFGYPVKDVMGFIGHPSLEHVKTTAWKVYGNPEPSDLILEQFDAAEKRVLELCQSLPLESVISELETMY